LRSIWIILNVIFWTVILGTSGILGTLFNRQGQFVSYIAHLWSKIILWSSGLNYTVHGLEYLDPNQHYVFAANHESVFDIPLAFAGLPFSMVAIAKQELKKIPIFGWVMSVGGFIFVDRSQHKKALDSLNAAAESLKNNPRSILLFPEGTRSIDGEIHLFKKGGLALAKKAGLKIVPMACCGTQKVLTKKSFSFKNQPVELRLGKPLAGEISSALNDFELAQLVRAQVLTLKKSWLKEQA